MIQRLTLLSTVATLVLSANVASAQTTSMTDLIAAAKKEGQLNVIALPRDWCGYGALIDSYKAKYGIKVK